MKKYIRIAAILLLLSCLSTQLCFAEELAADPSASVISEDFLQALRAVRNFLWDNILLFALFGTGIFLGFSLRFPQVKHLFPTIKKMIQDIIAKKPAKPGCMTPFQSLATSIAAQVGTGNIIGVAAAVAFGGPGAAFWMLLSAFFGMTTIFSEAVLAQLHREERNGEKVGGPAYYIKNGLRSKAFAMLFAVLCIVALGIVGVMVQANAVVTSLNTAFNIPTNWATVGLLVVVGVILAGGMDRIAKFSETVVPVMAFAYIFGSIVIIFMNVNMLGYALKTMVVGAFNPSAVSGGVLGITIREAARYGLSRGLFSNEAGMGSTPHSHAVAEADHPAEQGFMAMIGVFISTFLICFCTVLINLTGGSYNYNVPAEAMRDTADLMTQTAFQNNFGVFGEAFLSVSLTCFALTTIVGWYFFAESNVKFIAGERKVVVSAFRIISLAFLVVGSLFVSGDFVWTLADLFMGLMALPNIIALVLLNKQTQGVLTDYEACKKAGEISWSGEKLKKYASIRLRNKN